MELSFYNKASLSHLYDDVLVRCIIEFRHALGMLERNGLHLSNSYIDEMRKSLELMEAELARRSLRRAR